MKTVTHSHRKTQQYTDTNFILYIILLIAPAAIYTVSFSFIQLTLIQYLFHHSSIYLVPNKSRKRFVALLTKRVIYIYSGLWNCLQ